ncbi:MAG TPA: c-type cytochrome [Bacteroidota bacterium]|nr:c-type cytochrome [Bacteroidota bacterium]
MKRFLFACILLLSAVPLFAQRWEWPDTAKHLTVLPKSTSARDLQRTMFGFTAGLGVRCTFCHVGEEGKDFSQYDFVSDAKPEKNEARTMIRMMNNINDVYLAELHVESNSPLRVSCMTCHRGSNKPILLEDKLKRTFDRFGIDSTIKQYHTLRDQYYGGFTYNFKEGTLVRLAELISDDTAKTTAAIQVLKLNIELYPAFPFSYVRLAGLYEGEGKSQEAIENYKQALKLDPNNWMAKGRLERLQNKK